VLLVCDASGMARSVAALARGYRDFDPELRVGGVVCNRVGGRGHLDLLRRATADDPRVFGGFPEDAALEFPERQLGLYAASRDVLPDAVLSAWGERAEAWLDLDGILRLARSAGALPVVDFAHPSAQPARCRIGVAYDAAFHFYYEDNLRRLASLGAEIVRFSPIHAEHVPDVDGLYFGGGYPELHAEALSRNRGVLDGVAALAHRGAPIYGECGGLMYLCEGIHTLDGRRYPMAALLPGEAWMCERLQALGYVEVETTDDSFLGPAGAGFRGHQFRYSELRGASDGAACVYALRRPLASDSLREGYRQGSVLGSYVHAHWASNPAIAGHFVGACAAFRAKKQAPC
jgi:cobyrinic acid a,c-diamide synthase